jgi:fimbrial chaperone protein
MQPGVLSVTSAAPIAQFEFSSLSAQTRVFEVRVLRWTQSGGQDVLTPDNGLIVVPTVFSVEPYQTVIIRIEQRASGAPSVEQSYKVIVTDVVPGAATPPPNARHLESTLFVQPAKPAPAAAFMLKTSAQGQADLVVTNHGNAHLYLGNVSIKIAQRDVYAGTLAGYVLANSTRTFHLRVTGAPAASNADLTFDDAQGQQNTVRVTVLR